MPEQTSGPGAERVDAVIDPLIGEVVGEVVGEVELRSSAPGVERAFRAVTGRRLALATSAIVVVLAVIAGFATWQSDHRGVPVVAVPSERVSSPPISSPAPDVPTPALLTLDRLNRASVGWVSWKIGTADVTDVSPCRVKGAPLPEPRDSSGEHFRVPARVDGSFERMTFGSRAASDAALRTLIEGVESCAEKTHVSNADFSAELEVVAYRWGSRERAGVVWLVNAGSRVDVFQVVGSLEPSDDVLAQVSRIMAADVQTP